MAGEPVPPEETLDPEDWEALSRLGHRMVDDMLAYLQGVRGRPVWRPIPEDVRARLRAPLPEEGEGAERVYRDFVENVLPYPTGNIHPRFWGWVKGTGTPFAMLAEMLAAGMNCNVTGFDDAATLVESQVLDWCKAALGYPAEASGLLVTGGSMANLVGLTVARSAGAGADVRRVGLRGLERSPVLYASAEAHHSIQKAVEILGLGADALRRVPVNADFEIDLAALDRAISADRRAGLQPFCVVGNAGTVNTGAVDDLEALADLARREGLWLHVDGAFGAWAALAGSQRPGLQALGRADSLAFDLHKWMYLPYDVGCTLVRARAAHQAAFSFEADYLQHVERGAAGGALKFSDYGLQLSRSFRALKVWMSFREHGRRKLARLVEQNLAQAQYLASQVRVARDLELMAPVPLNIVCFRFVGEPPAANLDEMNREILYRLQEEGLAVPSSTTLRGRFALRVAITNHRSRREDFDLLLREVRRLGRELSGR